MTSFRLRRLFVAAVVLVVLTLGLSGSATTAISNGIVISQVYGGGGNTGAPLTNDFIELFNRGTSAVDLTGWSLQYASATGPANFGGATNLLSELSGTLAPGQYLAVKEAAGTDTQRGLHRGHHRLDADRDGGRRRQGRARQTRRRRSAATAARRRARPRRSRRSSTSSATATRTSSRPRRRRRSRTRRPP